LGWVVKTNADLDDIARVRLGNQQIKAVDVKDGVRGTDQGGHIVGSRFFGPGEQINLYPMSSSLNLSEWKAMENGWAKAMVEGKDVKIEVNAIYSGTSARPIRFRVIQEINGEETVFNFINN
jgi:filamentous hemagglutinin